MSDSSSTAGGWEKVCNGCGGKGYIEIGEDEMKIEKKERIKDFVTPRYVGYPMDCYNTSSKIKSLPNVLEFDPDDLQKEINYVVRNYHGCIIKKTKEGKIRIIKITSDVRGD